MELLLRQYSALQSLHGPSYGAGRRYAFQQQPDIDNMNYEQMLRAFGNGTENMGAQDTVISQLPTHELKDPQKELPEDARQCAICLDDFEKGETRMCLPCFHGFHEGCCQKWLRQNGKCPVCQHRVSTNSFSNDD
jgi:E3 ubiquitin-protein ligase BIG BROTHER-like protein